MEKKDRDSVDGFIEQSRNAIGRPLIGCNKNKMRPSERLSDLAVDRQWLWC